MVINNDNDSIIFLGSGPVAAKSLEFLMRHFCIEMVITKSKPAHHKGAAPVEELVENYKLPVLFASNKAEVDDIFATNKFSSRLGIVVDYGVIISESVIDSFELGILNSHFSLLPQWRGADPITFAILSGQPKTGVSLMLIEPSLDTGKLITRKSIAIEATDTTPILTDKLINLSNELILDYVPRYLDGDIHPKSQPHPDRATYSRKLTKSDGLIDWTKSAAQIEREVRAYYGWPSSFTTIFDKKITVLSASVVSSTTNPLQIKCGDGQYLSIDSLISPSGKTMNSAAFLNGYNK